MNAVQIIQQSQEETLFLLWDEYQKAFGGNCVINAAIEATRHRHESKRKHITHSEAKACVEYALYGTLVDGENGSFGGIGQMINISYLAMQKARTPEQRNHFERKLNLLRSINFALEDIYRD